MRDVNKGLQFEVDDLKQKLNDANGDIKVSTRSEFPFPQCRAAVKEKNPLDHPG